MQCVLSTEKLLQLRITRDILNYVVIRFVSSIRFYVISLPTLDSGTILLSQYVIDNITKAAIIQIRSPKGFISV